MAFLEKIFPRRPTLNSPQQQSAVNGANHGKFSGCTNQCKNRNMLHFHEDQVRLVLFRECDYRGRKLLFDSEATHKVPLTTAEAQKEFLEVANGYGYFVVPKQSNDYQNLSEMIFGSVAMSFRGTYLKIHSLSSPNRLMFTQVFPSPHLRKPKTSSTSSHLSTRSSFEHKLDDSGANSAYSTSDRLSDRSTVSDTLVVCRRLDSNPLDIGCFSRSSMIGDSGCAGQSFSSISTGPVGSPIWESVFSNKELSTLTFSSSRMLKKYLRNSTRSLHSMSLPTSTEGFHKPHQTRGSKLGLTIIIQMPYEIEKFLTEFLMEHIALIESLIWRTRHTIELAYHQRRCQFISLMMEVAERAGAWLVKLCDPPRLVNLWQNLSTGCDISYISERTDLRPKDSRDLFSFTRFLKLDQTKELKQSDRFLKEFCELLEYYDVKDTNFFISTLITAVLTNHLGWVSTVFGSEKMPEEEKMDVGKSYNALWGQLADYFGTVGYPAKLTQTIVTGSNKFNIVNKLLNVLTYFIRANQIERREVQRCGIEEDNLQANLICSNNNCIPIEKRYEDHLKEILSPRIRALSKTVKCTNLAAMNAAESSPEQSPNNVTFVLGEDDLLDLKKDEKPLGGAKRKVSTVKRPTCQLHSSSSCQSLTYDTEHSVQSNNVRAQSEPPEIRKITPPKYQYSRVKFNLHQYPQVVRNYMKSKNIELEGLLLGDKGFDKFSSVQHIIKLDLTGYESDNEEVEALQTPSNASELEFSPDMGTEIEENAVRKTAHDIRVVDIPMPKSLVSKLEYSSLPYSSTVIKGLGTTYLPDMVLQGTIEPPNLWDWKLKSDLAISTQHSLLDQPLDEALAIVANTNTWEVQIISSHTYVIDKGSNGVRAGMSRLVADMLESLLQMWKLHIPPQNCLMHIEQRLQEVCVRSKALAHLLLNSEFCNLESLTSTLRIEISDVPLLMAVASTLAPEVTRKYGLSFQ